MTEPTITLREYLRNPPAKAPIRQGKGEKKGFLRRRLPSAPPLSGATARGRKKRQAGASLMLFS